MRQELVKGFHWQLGAPWVVHDVDTLYDAAHAGMQYRPMEFHWHKSFNASH
jgi:hypothetical protein